MLKIDIHTHILPPEIPKFKDIFGYGGFIELIHKPSCCDADMVLDSGKFFRKVEPNCFDPQARLEDCKKHNVDIQVLSTVPVMFSYWTKPKDGLYVAQYINNHLAEVVAQTPKKFIALGTLPMQSVELSIKEARRCVNELKMPGFEIGTHINNKNLSHPDFFPLYEALEDMGAALFIHPWEMMGQSDMPDYWLPWLVGMPAESARAISSLIFGGVFEKFPKLRVAIAHGGGAFPYTIGRIQHGHDVRPDLCAVDCKTPPRDFLGHFYVDSLVHDERALKYLIDTIGVNKICLGTDYPFPLGELEPGKLIESSTWLDDKARKALFSGSALEWLNLSEKQFI